MSEFVAGLFVSAEIVWEKENAATFSILMVVRSGLLLYVWSYSVTNKRR
jgi:hypothetical protein